MRLLASHQTLTLTFAMVLLGCDETSSGSDGGDTTSSTAAGWAEWTCTPSGTNYCYATHSDGWIKCYPTTDLPCYGSNFEGSCPANDEPGCDSCEFAFQNCTLD